MSLYYHIIILPTTDESRTLHGQTEQYDAERGQQFVRGRSAAHSGNDTKM